MSRQRAFELSFLHVDFEAEEDTKHHLSRSWLSDHGKGARLIRELTEAPSISPDNRLRCINRGKHLIARKAPDVLPVFWLVLKNGKNRRKSIDELVEIKMRERTRSKRNIRRIQSKERVFYGYALKKLQILFNAL